MNRFAVATMLAAALFLAPADGAEGVAKTFEVFPLGFAEMDSTLEAAQSLVGEAGHVIPDRTNQRLLIYADADLLDQLRGLLGQLNVAPRNVFIEVEFAGSAESSELGMELEVESGLVVIQRNPVGRITLRPVVTARSEREQSQTRQSLLVASGREASLRVGERVPWIQWINQWGLRHRVYEVEIAWQDVGAFLVVQPTIIGDGPLIHIRLIPELSGLVDGNPHHVRYTQAATEVIVAAGETVSLGGLTGENEFYRRFLIGFERTSGSRQLDIRLTPRL